MATTAKEKRHGGATILFTDLDGTLLDRETYDFHDALPALDLARTRRVPVVLCSSKTRAEQTELRTRLCIDDPFIVEDGSAICIERGYFPFEFVSDTVDESLLVIRLCPRYTDVRRAILAVRRETGIDIRGYGDLGDAEVSHLTGLDQPSAARARAREFQETIVTPLSEKEASVVARALAAKGLRLTRGGRFFGVTGVSDKGAAACILAELFRRARGPARLVGIGDSFNDRSLFEVVDIPALVQRRDNTWDPVDVPGLKRVEGVGPMGWNRFVMEMLAAEGGPAH